MPDQNDLIHIRNCLKSTTTTVRREDGTVVEEQRGEDGNFEVVFEDDGKGNGAHPFQPSNRMAKWAGMVLDMHPDMKAALVSEGVFLSAQDVAQDHELLHSLQITHIVNVATGVGCLFREQIEYLDLTHVLDMPYENLKQHFEPATTFMRNAVENGQGRVLVHCNMGVSRSSSLVLAYIMRYERMPLAKALDRVRSRRPIIRPNDGFMQQLREYEKELGLLLEQEENGEEKQQKKQKKDIPFSFHSICREQRENGENAETDGAKI